jgi:hypothetical protein
MALVLKDRVQETSVSTGTGTVTLDGAVAGYQTFSTAIASGSTVYYTITAQTGSNWEVGVGTFTSPDQLSRTTVLSSSNSGSLVNFPAGTKNVFVTQPSEQALYTNQATGLVEASGNGSNNISFTTITANNANLTYGTINTVPAIGTDIANKAYVDTTATGLHIHQAVLVARLSANYSAIYVDGGTTPTWNTITSNSILDTGGSAHSLSTNAVIVFGNVGSSNVTAGFGYFVKSVVNSTAITISTIADGPNVTSLTNGTSLGITSRANSGIGATLTATANGTFTQDGVTVPLNGRVLFNAQTTVAQNGIYDLTTTGSSTTKAVLTRSANENTYSARSSNGLGEGDYFYVTSGTVNAGKSFVLGTTGTIIFGTTNLTFDQFSATTVYSAGTGLTLTDTVFSITNTAVTSATYGDSGNVAQITVNAQGQLTNAANVAINASSITLGTLDNARTTAASANGASTIVLRDSNGSFIANVVAATTVNATTGNFTNITGNAVSLTAINASNITSGTLDNARTTANTSNSASTIVLRDASGNFGANTISGAFSGDGSAINAINASNLSSGTVANARTTAASANGASTIVLRDSSGGFGAGNITAVSISGNGVALTAINASNIASGTIDNARTTAATANGASTIVLRDSTGSFSAGVITANGSALSAINASNISSGTIDNARTTANTSNSASTIVLRDANGSFAGNVITGVTGTFTNISGNGSSLTAINASNISSGTIGNTYTTANSSNSASTIVLRDSNGSFAGNVITGTTGTFTSVSGNGVALTAINASNISSGTVATARLATGTANSTTYLRGDQTWASISGGITITNDTSTNASYYTVFTTATSGSISAANVSSTELIFNPGTNALTAPNVLASNGLFVNNMTVGASYSIPSGYSASSVGPVTVSSGVSVTVPSGSRWVVL